MEEGGGYVNVRGTRFYVERHGEGDPLVLLHGAWTSLESFALQVETLRKHFEIILIERRGHGRTPDTEGAYSYQQGVDDMIAVLEEMGVDEFHLLGWSDGAVIGLMMAAQNLERVRGFISISGAYSRRGFKETFLKALESMRSEDLPRTIREIYTRVSPDGPDHFSVVFEKVKEMFDTHPEYGEKDLEIISTPVLIMCGDRDVIRLSHAVSMYESLPYAELSVIPGGSHMLPMEKSAMVNDQIINFLSRAGRP